MGLPKTYQPKQYEPTVYGLWEASGVFKPTGEGTPYGIALPPPNANGTLHMGHALDMGLKDISTRYRRMKGDDAVMIPGADHAGFETWVVYERKLAAEGKSRFDFSREELYDQIWEFVHEKRGDMELQLRALGIGASWDHMVFTLDKKVIETVYETFKKLWDDDLIYRGKRIVNYCTAHQTGFADIEVEYKEEKSKLWHIAYPLIEKSGELVVATTRPETLLGDSAVAIHPDDERYKDLIGSHVQLPILKKDIPIIADEAVDPQFGTGVVKVTPAHDPNDFEMGERHNLEQIEVIGHDGLMTALAGSFAGLEALEARKRILAAVETEELLRKTEDYSHSVGHCYKCGTIIQPLLMDQWFVRVKPLAERAITAIEQGAVNFVPTSKGKELANYLSQLKDWNISRQPAWGIPIPAFVNTNDPTDWIFDTRVDQPTIEVDGKKYLRDEDTFDTWFSSGQWPYIVTDALQSGELSRFYPTAYMETGVDILKAWVARMLMLGLYRTDQVPFKDVYLHGMVLDEKGQKMSKSKGNVLNPIEILSEYGSDALRLGLVANRSAGQSQAFSTASVVAGRNFCNKLWNISRYIEANTDVHDEHNPEAKTLADHWVIRQLNQAATGIGELLDSYRYAEAADLMYHTIWNDVADWYIEASKDRTGRGMMAWVLETCLKIAHPFAPFVTETIWTTQQWDHTLLAKSSWPESAEFSEISAAQFDQVKSLVAETRYVASELPGSKQTMLYENDSLIDDNASLIMRLANLKEIKHAEQPKGLRLAVANREAWLDVDADTLYEHQSKLELRLVQCRDSINRLKGRLSNEGYRNSAPAHIVAESEQQLKDQLSLEDKLVQELEVLEA